MSRGRWNVVFEIGKKEVFQLFKVYVRAVGVFLVERRGGVRVRNVFASE